MLILSWKMGWRHIYIIYCVADQASFKKGGVYTANLFNRFPAVVSALIPSSNQSCVIYILLRRRRQQGWPILEGVGNVVGVGGLEVVFRAKAGCTLYVSRWVKSEVVKIIPSEPLQSCLLYILMRATGVQERSCRFYKVLWELYRNVWRLSQIGGKASKGVENLQKSCGESTQVV
jgi:hypothetical protein